MGMQNKSPEKFMEECVHIFHMRDKLKNFCGIFHV